MVAAPPVSAVFKVRCSSDAFSWAAQSCSRPMAAWGAARLTVPSPAPSGPSVLVRLVILALDDWAIAPNE